jgi:hypothetical protein
MKSPILWRALHLQAAGTGGTEKTATPNAQNENENASETATKIERVVDLTRNREIRTVMLPTPLPALEIATAKAPLEEAASGVEPVPSVRSVIVTVSEIVLKERRVMATPPVIPLVIETGETETTGAVIVIGRVIGLREMGAEGAQDGPAVVVALLLWRMLGKGEVRAEERREVRMLGSPGGMGMRGVIGIGVIGAIGITGRERGRIDPGMIGLQKSRVGKSKRNGFRDEGCVTRG